ncbi:hypothetical protein ACVMGC_004838 [Bradyrhizobium barranii subsp. barranii]|uniref:hypothetical protein n=1 Tax=Bradyrhizobium liaoningense TaxID=43992 RepID=UPI001BA689F3|nr:hypothetical protein [Bradyrhizobium liaoningense]MBR0884774.1 hypothetical protein [Bradyrhizobium liaoningense]
MRLLRGESDVLSTLQHLGLAVEHGGWLELENGLEVECIGKGKAGFSRGCMDGRHRVGSYG